MTKRFIGIIALSLVPLSIVYAQSTRYITDQLEVTMRSGQSTQHKVLRMLPSGAPVTLIEDDKDSGYSHVRLPNGDEGWVITRYLMTQPSARDQLAETQETIKRLQSKQGDIGTQVVELGNANKELTKENQQFKADNERLNAEITRIRQTAANALSIDSENQSLKKRLFDIERQNQLLEQQNAALQDRSDRDWFVAGAGVLFMGMLLGVVVPKLRWRKKSSWGSL